MGTRQADPHHHILWKCKMRSSPFLQCGLPQGMCLGVWIACSGWEQILYKGLGGCSSSFNQPKTQTGPPFHVGAN